MEEIDVPADAFRYILYQRTDYLALPRRRLLFRLLNRLSPWPPLRTAVNVESVCRRGQVRRSFSRDMAEEYADIRDWLPERAESVLDIGCGVGGIDVMLHRHYGNGMRLYLLDKTRTETDVFYGFERAAAFYNSLTTAQRMLEDNGVPAGNIHLREVREDNRIEVDEPLDLVISLISWGFHYPVSTYVDEVHGHLRPGGRVILDVRRDTEGMEDLERRFAELRVISEAPKKRRVVATR